MLSNWKIALVGITLGTAPLVGCASATPQQGDRVYVREEPPPRRREPIVDRPGRDYVYIRGHYVYARNGRYEWVPGRWERPAQGRRARWVDGKWVHDRNGWYYIEGHWR
jgi:hypothetical protein